MSTSAAALTRSIGRFRYVILTVIFALTVVNYADRAILSIAGPSMSDELRLNAVSLGFVFSAFGWSYVIGQLPGGWLLDRYGTKWVYAGSIALWSLFTLFQGLTGFFVGGAAVAVLFSLRFLVGFAEAPAFPANARIVSVWFPVGERGFASAVFNAGQYFATVLFAPLMAWIVHAYGWRQVFWVMGALGIVMTVVWLKVIRPPRTHPLLGAPELEHIIEGGGLVDIEETGGSAAKVKPTWGAVKELLSNRMLMGVYVAQFCITAQTYFFLTWFPVYLVKERGLNILQAGFAAVLPALCGFFGGLLGGIISDYMLRRTGSATLARKVPIVGGMLLSMVMIGCNYVNTPAMVIGLMTLAYFGKGIGSLGWAVVSDTSPKEIPGLNGGLFNMFGNAAGITTPIVIGYLVAANHGSFDGALVFVALNALVALVCYIFVVGEIRRVELTKPLVAA